MDKASGSLSYRHGSWGISANMGGNYFLPQNGTNNNYRTTTLNDTTSLLTQLGTTRTDRRKEKMLREMWSKVELS